MNVNQLFELIEDSQMLVIYTELNSDPVAMPSSTDGLEKVSESFFRVNRDDNFDRVINVDKISHILIQEKGEGYHLGPTALDKINMYRSGEMSEEEFKSEFDLDDEDLERFKA